MCTRNLYILYVSTKIDIFLVFLLKLTLILNIRVILAVKHPKDGQHLKAYVEIKLEAKV